MATYAQIQDWIKENYHFTPKTCWIAHVKELSKLPLNKAPNRIDPNHRVHPCPKDKIEIVQTAFRHFKML